MSNRKAGSILQAEERRIVLSVYEKLFARGGKTVSECVAETAYLTGVGKSTVYNIRKEAKKSRDQYQDEEPHFETPGKKHPNRAPPLAAYDESTQEAVRKIIHREFFSKQLTPSLSQILKLVRSDETIPKMGRSTLHLMLTQKLNFKYTGRGWKDEADVLKNEDSGSDSVEIQEPIVELVKDEGDILKNEDAGAEIQEPVIELVKDEADILKNEDAGPDAVKIQEPVIELVKDEADILKNEDAGLDGVQIQEPVVELVKVEMEEDNAEENESDSEEFAEDHEDPLMENKMDFEDTEEMCTPEDARANNEKSCIYKCDICKKTFTKNSFLRHFKTHNENRPFSCDFCTKTFRLKSYLKEHLNTHIKEKIYTCPICSKSFSARSSLRFHKFSHSGDRSFECDVCKKTFYCKNNLEVHYKRHKKFRCDVCGKSFNQEQQLTAHSHTHTVLDSYKCKICDLLIDVPEFFDHYIKHTGTQLLLCDTCGESFTDSSELKLHCLRHLRDKSYTCNLCNQSFNESRDLFLHYSIHFGAKPCVCEMCYKMFSDSDQLFEHYRTHILTDSYIKELTN